MIKNGCRGAWTLPTPRTKGDWHPMAKVTIAERLAELEEKYRRELMGEEERLELRERILKLKAKTEKAEAR